MKSLMGSVGRRAKNSARDVAIVIDLMHRRRAQKALSGVLSGLKIPAPDDTNLELALSDAISEFQRVVQKSQSPDGVVGPAGTTILFLGGIRTTGKQIIVDLADQNLYAYEGATLVHSFYCATGDRTHPTAIWPSVHHTFRKHEKYRSRAYDAQMNYAMFFTSDGKAIHQSNAVAITSILKDWGISELGSHGCVRLSEENAKTLFEWAPMNTLVFIDLEKL